MVGQSEGWYQRERDCRLMKRTTVLHGGVSHRTSTPHKSWNKMKKNEKIKEKRMKKFNTSCKFSPFGS